MTWVDTKMSLIAVIKSDSEDKAKRLAALVYATGAEDLQVIQDILDEDADPEVTAVELMDEFDPFGDGDDFADDDFDDDDFEEEPIEKGDDDGEDDE